MDAHRPYHNEPIPDVTLFFPDTLPREQRERFLLILTAEIEKLTGQHLRVIHQVAYPVGAGQREGASLMRHIERRASTSAAGVAIVILWQNFGPSVHGALKETFDAGHSQCVTEAKVRELTTGAEQSRIAGLVRNLALALLTEVPTDAFELERPGHRDRVARDNSVDRSRLARNSAPRDSTGGAPLRPRESPDEQHLLYVRRT